MHVGRGFFFQGKEGIAEFLLVVAMQVEFGAAGVDHDLAGVVIEKEGHVHTLGSNLDPLVASASTFPLPDDGAVVVARPLRDGRRHRVWPHGEAAEFDHADRGAAYFGDRGVEDEVPAAQQTEAVEEEIDSGAESDDAPGDRADRVLRTKKQSRED